jgi:primary-amine oxidase
MTVDADPTAPHPLDPLTEDEVKRATAALRADPSLPEAAPCCMVALHEPPKSELLAFRPGDPVDRWVRYLLYDKGSRTAYDVIVSATHERVVSSTAHPGSHPSYLMVVDFLLASEAVRADERFIAGCRVRGVEDMRQVQLDPWPAGRFGQPWETTAEGATRRICRIVGYLRHTPGDNGYAHPLDGLVGTVDLDEMTVIDVLDDGTTTIPATCSNYDVGSVGPLREGVRPIEITQPDGPSFELRAGNHLTWEKWRLRFSLHPIEGLVLHQVTWDGRSVLHRAGLAEMVVPYAGDGPNTWWKNTFDAGELSMGRLANPLTHGCDCLGDITYVDQVFCDDNGNPFTLPNVVCVHEEDAGVLWKHTDLHTGSVEVRRARRLVLNTVITAGNYEYIFSWHLWNDGRLGLEVRLTGIAQTEGVGPDGTPPERTRLIQPGLAAAHHQHLFCMRLDLDVDGRDNRVVETDLLPVPSEHGHAWDAAETVVASEADGVRDHATDRGRRWRVVNEGVRNAVGQPVGYELVPMSPGPLMLASPESSVARRATFARHALWVTAYDDKEIRAAGDFPNLSAGGAGLPAYVAQGRSLVDTDVVLWHSFGSTHVVRPEDWPVMPVEICGFMLRPVGFSDRNPALDVPPPAHCAQ